MKNAIVPNEKDLDKYLKQRKNYSFSYLKKEFGYKEDVAFLNYLVEYFNKKLDNYNFESDINTNKYLSKLLKYYGYSMGKINLKQAKENKIVGYIENLEKLANKIKKEVSDNVDDTSSKTAIKNSIYLLMLEEEIKSIEKNIIKKIELPKKIEIVEKDQLCDMLKSIVFDIQNTNILDQTLNSFPNIVLLKDYDDKFLFEKILDKYYNVLLNKNDYYEKLYYDKVIDLYAKYQVLSDDKVMNELFYQKMKKFIETTLKKELDQNKIDYIISDINERIRQFEVGNRIDFLEEKDDKYYDEINFDHLQDLTASKTLKDRKRRLITDKHIITIDNNNAKVLENAISVEKDGVDYVVTTYVVDMAYFISCNKGYERQKYINILEQGNMNFNKKYKYENFNLLEGKTVPVIAYRYILDKNKKLKHFEFERAEIKVLENIKFMDFNNLENLSKKTQEVFLNLLEICDVNPDLYLDNEKLIDNMIYLINDKSTKVIANYCSNKNLPLIYRDKTDNTDIDILKEKHDIDLGYINLDSNHTNIIYTIGNDKIKDERDFNISIFSPTRRLDALINQMLVSSYLVDHNRLDYYTINYLVPRLDKIAEYVNKSKNLIEKDMINENISDIKKKVKQIDK